MIPGGKGANQACAAGQLAGRRWCGWSAASATNLRRSPEGQPGGRGCGCQRRHAVRTEPTGVALICVDPQGQNSIIVASGRERRVSRGGRRRLAYKFPRRAVCPLPVGDSARYGRGGAALARREGAKTILDPAPAQALSSDLLPQVDILTPNESEACILLGRPPVRITSGSLRARP